MEIYEKVKIVLREILQCDDYHIYPEANLRKDLGIDERIGVEIYNKLSEMFGAEATRQEALKLKTVQDLVEFIENKI